jgi:membrane protease YdiL (CAAX protease family)
MQRKIAFVLFDHIFSPLVGLAGYLSMIFVSLMLSKGNLPILRITAFGQLNFLVTMQLFLLPISLLVLGIVFFYDQKNFRLFLGKGDIGARFEVPKLLGCQRVSTWKKVGPVVLTLVTIVTIAFTSLAVFQMKGVINSRVLTLFPFALFLALSNSWVEETFGRFAIVAGLYGRAKPGFICLISAAIFGIPHYFGGNPSGFLGVVITGVLGWLLAKSVYETKGLFWALLIHFIADVVIFTAQIMIFVGSSGA